METIRNMQSAWKDDSFYVQTISTNGAAVLRTGAIGFLASRISGVGIPKDQAVYSIIYEIIDIFSEFVEKKLIEKSLLSNKEEDKFSISCIRRLLGGEVTGNICRLMQGKAIVIIPQVWQVSQKQIIDWLKIFFTKIVINVAIDVTTSLIFPKPREAS